MEVREGCGPLELTRRRRGRIPLRTTLSQIPLKSCGFPGAESARKRFFLRRASPRSEKISTRGDQPKSLISLGRSQSDLPALWASNLSDAQVASLDWKSRGFTSSRALPWLFWHGFLFPTKRAILLTAFVSDGVGRSAPLLPLGRRGARGLRPSRALPGAILLRDWFPTMQVCSFEGFRFRRCGLSFCGRCFRRRGRGALCSPTPPRGRGARGLRPSCALPELFWWRFWFPTMQAILLKAFVSDGTGVGRSAPLHPLGRRVREGSHPLALSQGCSGVYFGSRRNGR